MAKRKVFGRRRALYRGRTYLLELREDGLYVRRLFSTYECRIEFERICQYGEPQFEMPGLTYGLDQSNQTATVSTMPKDQLVPDKPEGADSPVHEAGQQSPAPDEGRVTGLDTPDGREVPAAECQTGTNSTEHQLPKVD